MASTIDQAFVNLYSRTLYKLAQQQGSRLLPYVRVENENGGEAYFFDRLAPFTAVEQTDRDAQRHGDTPVNDAPHSKRQALPSDFEWGDLVDKEDKLRLLIQPESHYNENAKYAIGRQVDSHIITKMLGNALTKDGSTVALGAGQTVDTDVGGTTTGLNLDKVIATAEVMNAAEVPDEGRVFVFGSKQLSDVLAIAEFTSQDYNVSKALHQGGIASFMGFTWIRSERLALNTTVRDCIAFQKNGFVFNMAESMFARITEDPTKRYAHRVYCRLTGGGVRLEEERVVKVQCTES
jgi:hypothetical protein